MKCSDAILSFLVKACIIILSVLKCFKWEIVGEDKKKKKQNGGRNSR